MRILEDKINYNNIKYFKLINENQNYIQNKLYKNLNEYKNNYNYVINEIGKYYIKNNEKEKLETIGYKIYSISEKIENGIKEYLKIGEELNYKNPIYNENGIKEDEYTSQLKKNIRKIEKLEHKLNEEKMKMKKDSERLNNLIKSVDEIFYNVKNNKTITKNKEKIGINFNSFNEEKIDINEKKNNHKNILSILFGFIIIIIFYSFIFN